MYRHLLFTALALFSCVERTLVNVMIPEDAILSDDGLFVLGRGERMYGKPVSVKSLENLMARKPGDPHVEGSGPRRITEKQWENYLELLRNGGFRAKSAKAAGMAYVTVRTRRKADPDFAQAEIDAEEDGVEDIEDALRKSAKKGNVTAQIFVLQNKAKNKYRDMRRPDKIELVGNVTHTNELGQSSMDAILALAARLEERRALVEGTVIDLPGEEIED